jgi:hypothetical protein
MKKVLQLEELAQMVFGIIGLYLLSFDLQWWLWIILFLSPDISFLAYCINKKTGAIGYNFFHHKGIAIAIAATGFFYSSELMMFIGTLLFTHSSFDRLLGYGLKYPDDFKHTHLGFIGKKNNGVTKS